MRCAAHRALITLCVMMGNLVQSLDASIANVSLPYMQGTQSTSADEITCCAAPPTLWSRWFASGSCKACAAPRWCRCRRRPCWTSTR
jgi:hypothetical protein